MKTFITILVQSILVTGLAILITSCEDRCEATQEYILYEPVFITPEEIVEATRLEEPREFQQLGKIYLLGNLVFINELNEGIHIIDNTDPANPQKLSFLSIPGNHDMAAKGDILYADSYVDLVTFDISDIQNIQTVSRESSVFPNAYWNAGFAFDAVAGMIVEYNEIPTVETFDCTDSGPVFFEENVLFASVDAIAFSSPLPSTQAGVGGSTARFTLAEDYLYAVDDYQMHVFDIGEINEPKKENTIDLGWGIETIFPYKDNLFIGANNGMFIYSLLTPDAPSLVSSFLHVNSCDPVVVQDDVAYVTLRSGNTCAGFTNQLDVIDISTIESPRLLKSYDMQNPHGLGIDDNLLFITEGQFGLKVFDASDDLTIADNQLNHFDDFHAVDVIPYRDLLLVIGEDGLFQYSYSNNELQLLSHLSVDNF